MCIADSVDCEHGALIISLSVCSSFYKCVCMFVVCTADTLTYILSTCVSYTCTAARQKAIDYGNIHLMDEHVSICLSICAYVCVTHLHYNFNLNRYSFCKHTVPLSLAPSVRCQSSSTCKCILRIIFILCHLTMQNNAQWLINKRVLAYVNGKHH